MTTNCPNRDVQALIADCQAEIAELEKVLAIDEYAGMPHLQSKLKRQQVALAALTAKPVYQLIDDGKWYDAPKYLFDEASERGDECRIVYTNAPAQLLRPVELPEFKVHSSQPCWPSVTVGLRDEEWIEALRKQGYEVKS